MRLTREQVEHVALLGRLELTEEEIERFTTQLNAILEYVEQLNGVDAADVPPTSHVVPMEHPLRDDEVRGSIAPESVLEHAPDASGDTFRVPRVVDAE
jgi:aspartyl-tRNA(Asn)/glutamyl-tRNA(Gln) amidotransferase subunit C